MKCAEQIDNRPCFVYNEVEISSRRVIQMYLRRKVDAFLEEYTFPYFCAFLLKRFMIGFHAEEEAK
jgi:hypothetical protein